MTNRRRRTEFTKATKIRAWDRCKGFCEECGAKLYPGKFIFDHDNPDVISHDNSLENCKVRCVNCDKPKTAKDQKTIAKCRRVEEKHLGIAKPKAKSRLKKKISGEVVVRETGEQVWP